MECPRIDFEVKLFQRAECQENVVKLEKVSHGGAITAVRE
jgi:hypothetical protein